MRYWFFLVMCPYCISWRTAKKDPSFYCIGDYYNLTCTWDTDQCTFWNLMYRNRSRNVTEFVTCTSTTIREDRRVNCVENCMVAKKCTGHKHNQCVIKYNGVRSGILSNQEYEFELIGCSCDDSENFTYTVYTNDTITKLSLVDFVPSSNGTRAMDFAVGLKQSICEICNEIDNVIICNVNITSERTSVSQVRYYRHTCDKVYCYQDNGVYVNITNLTPFTKYEAAIRCRIETSNYWSDILHASFQTLTDVPLRGPDINERSFLLYPCNSNKECLAFYFKTLNLYQSQGPLIKYAITVNSTDNQNHVDFRQFDIMYTQKYPATLFLNTSVEYDHSYQIQINPVNEEGPSLQASTVLISPRNDVLVKPFCVDYKLNNNWGNGSYMLSYKIDTKNGDSSLEVTVTYFWCRGVRLSENEVRCESDFHWITSNDKSAAVTPNITLNNIYFAVSLSVNGVNSGMTWRKCLPSSYINITDYDKVVIGGVLGGSLALILVFAICWCLKKQADKIRSYNPEINVPQMISSEKFQYNSYTNQALDDGSNGTSGYDSVTSNASSSNPSPDMEEKIRTYNQIDARCVYSLPTENNTTYDMSTKETLNINNEEIIQHEHRSTDKYNDNKTSFNKQVTETRVIDDSNDQMDKVSNSSKERTGVTSLSDDSYRKVIDINTNSDIYFLNKGSGAVCSVPKHNDVIDNDASIDNTDLTSGTTTSTTSKEEIKDGYCRYNIHEIDSDSSHSGGDYDDSLDNIDYSD